MAKPATSKSNIVLPSKAKTATIKQNGTQPGTKHGAGQPKTKKS